MRKSESGSENMNVYANARNVDHQHVYLYQMDV